jgi:hypothetical protein
MFEKEKLSDPETTNSVLENFGKEGMSDGSLEFVLEPEFGHKYIT